MSDETLPEEPISIMIDEPFLAHVDPEALRAIVARALAQEGRPDGELTLVITSNDQVQELNRIYRGVDEPTDVLSFAAQESSADTDAPPFVSAPEAARYLGDVIIAYPYAAASAAAQGRAIADEISLLAVHGTLHLLGYDHGTADEEEVMWAHQALILTAP